MVHENESLAIVEATRGDFAAWLLLASEVEHLFGPMVHEPDFHRAVTNSIERSTALCARVDDGPPGSPLVGGILFSPRHPLYVIGWLAVASSARGRGLGKELVAEAVRRYVRCPCTIEVDTFGADHPGAGSRRFYEKLGFIAAETAPDGPEGGSRQMFRLLLSRPPAWTI